MQTGPFTIELTSKEVELADAIEFNPLEMLNDTQSFSANGDLVVELTNSLLDRKAIPTQRVKYFSDPQYNIGGNRKSRQERFLSQARSPDKMLRHGHFLKYLEATSLLNYLRILRMVTMECSLFYWSF